MITKDNLLNDLIEAINNLNEAEERIYNYINLLEDVQNKIMDIEHYLEDNELSENGKSNLILLLQELRLERRQIKQMWEIWNTYGNNKDKLKSKDNRPFIIAEMHKTDKSLQTKYKYRILEESYLDSLNEDISYNNNEEE